MALALGGQAQPERADLRLQAPGIQRLGCRNRYCDAGMVSPFLDAAPTPAKFVRLYQRSDPRGEDQTVISPLVPGSVPLVGLALGVFLQRVQAEVR